MAKVKHFQYTEFEERVRNLLTSLEIPYTHIEGYANAFVHRSILNEHSTPFKESNERLEFLGDAVLELTVTELLYQKYPEKPEGQLTDIRSAMVRWTNLAEISERLEFYDYLLLSRGEMLSEGNKNPYLLANAIEAFLWALYLDLWYDFSRSFVLKHVFTTLGRIMEERLHIDPKSYLQELTQALYNITPTYEVLEESGADHDKVYTMGIFAGETLLWSGNGSSKKKGQQAAAQNALDNKSEWPKAS